MKSRRSQRDFFDPRVRPPNRPFLPCPIVSPGQDAEKADILLGKLLKAGETIYPWHYREESVFTGGKIAREGQSKVGFSGNGYPGPYRFSVKKYKMLFDSLGEAIHVADASLKILFMNRAFREWNKKLGIDADPEGKTVFELFPFLRKSIAREYEKVLETGKPFVTEDWSSVDGKKILTETKKVPFVENGKPVGVITIIRDITEGKRKEESPRENLRFKETLVKTIPFPMDIVSEDGTLLFLDEKMKALLGKDHTGNKCWQAYKDDRKQCPHCPLKKKISLGRTETIETEGCLEGRSFRITHTGMLFKGKPAVLEVFEDITAQKKAAESLKTSEEKYRSLFNNSEVGMFRTRLDGSEILDMNEKFLTIFGRTREEMRGKPSIIHWAIPRERKEMVRRLKSKGSVTDFECRMLNKKGEMRVCLTSLRLYPEQGILEGSITDITDRKKTEDKLRESEEFLRSTLNSMDDLVVIIGSKGTILGFHKPPSRVSFLDTKSHVGKDYKKALPWEITEKLTPALERARATGLTQNFVHTLDTSAKKGWFSVNVSVRRGATGEVTGFTIVSRDITESKRIEERIATSEREYRGLLETLNEGVWVTDKDSFIKFANPKIAQMLGYSVKELIGEHVFSFMDEKGMELSKKIIQRRRKGVRENYNFELIRKDSSRINVLIGASPLLDNDDAFLGSVASITDITELKRIEEGLSDSLSNYQILIDSLEVSAILVDEKMQITSCNKRFRGICASLGVFTSPIGKRLQELAGIIPKRLMDGHGRVLESGKPESIKAAYLHNNKKFSVEARISPIFREGRISGLIAIIGNPVEIALMRKSRLK